jgi:hypothetical protein
MGSPLGLQRKPAREGAGNSAQSRPLAENGFPLDWQPDFWKTGLLTAASFPSSAERSAPLSSGVSAVWGFDLSRMVSTRRTANQSGNSESCRKNGGASRTSMQRLEKSAASVAATRISARVARESFIRRGVLRPSRTPQDI